MEHETDHMISFVIENKDLMAKFLYSSQYDSRVMVRETVTIIEASDGARLSASQELVTNYGSAFERTESTNSPKSDERLVQIVLLLKRVN